MIKSINASKVVKKEVLLQVVDGNLKLYSHNKE